MKIGLVDCDSHNFPNLPLMKLSAYHKKAGDCVSFARMEESYDRLYVSKIFTESPEPVLPVCGQVIRGGSGYDLENKLPEEIEHIYPNYTLYPELTRNTAYGFLTRGCPRRNHTFCITPQKDGCVSRKAADLAEFWSGQSNIVLLDQNILACKERMELLCQLADSGALVEFNGGMDIRFLNEPVIEALKKIRVKNYHFAWDDPREKLQEKFRLFQGSGLKVSDHCRVYVLTNYWSSTEEDLFRIHTLLELGFLPFVMIYDKQKYGSSKEFYTIKTANNNTFYLVVDRSQTAQNVYMLSTIDENDLKDFIEAAETESEKETEPAVVIPETEKEEETEPVKEETKTGNSNMGAMLLVMLTAAVGIGAYYFIKIRPKKEEEDTDSENLEVGDGLETVNEDGEDFDEYDEE